ncbi:interleukin-33 [Saccopteryx bilineata]|uniref:interleukin-33 n=1 Tax=Saccopteryx bilineata TaxID=59482 RepID=UPI00338D3B4D
MKYPTTKISPVKMNNLARKPLVKTPRVRKSQQKAEEVCQLNITQLRSGLIIDKKRKETTQSPLKTVGNNRESLLLLSGYGQHQDRLESTKHFVSHTEVQVQKCILTTDSSSIQECSVSLSTYNDQSVTFAFADGSYEIYVEELGKTQGKDEVLFRYYDSQSPVQGRGDHIDGHGRRLMVNLSPTKDRNFLLHANNKEHSVELQKCENPLPEQTFFFLHKYPSSSKCVSFECKSNPGVFIGVEDNHLALIKLKDQNEQLRSENIKFKLS